MTESGHNPEYKCSTEIERPKIVLVHRPSEETHLAFYDPETWGFDPYLKNKGIPFEKWLKNAQKEHDGMTSVLKGKGISVLYLTDLLEENQNGCKRYLERQFK